jgi:hypothetical protein
MSTVNSPLQWQDAAIAGDRAVTNRNGAYELHPRGTGDQEEAGANDSSWFTSDDFCLPSSPARESLLASFRKKMPDHLGLIRLFNRSRKLRPDWLAQYQIDWPSGLEPRWQYVLPDSHRISFRTLSSQFYVIGRPFQRPKLYNEQLPIHRLSIMDKAGHLVGYVDIPDPASRPIKLGLRDFVVLSRSTANGQYEPEPDVLGGSRRRLLSIKRA